MQNRKFTFLLFTLMILLLFVASPLLVSGQSLDYPIYLPIVMKSSSGAGGSAEWSQHAHDAQRTSYYPEAIPTPWRWKWAWNGPNASGAISNGKFRLPRNSQPITGAGRVYIAAGANGVYALNVANGAVLWNFRPQNAQANSTPAYDPDTQSLFALFSNGVLYKLNASNGQVQGQVNGGGQSDLPLPAAIAGEQIFFGIGNTLFAIDKRTLQSAWQYSAGAQVHTPPAYSASRNLVIVATSDLYVHAVRASDGTRQWRVKPTVLQPGDPGSSGDNNLAEFSRGWPVIADDQGVVLIRYRLDWQSLWDWNPSLLSTNAQMRAFLQNNPAQQCLFALDLDDGATAFIPNVGNGGFGDGGYLPMGPMPVIKTLDAGRQIAYVVMRGYPCLEGVYCDSRGDSRLGEMMLDDQTVAGYLASYVRYMDNTYFPTDEQAFLSMAGDQIFAAHWEAGIAHRIGDRSASRGTGNNPITTLDLPHIATSQDNDVCGTGFQPSHYCASGLSNTRVWPAGFYIYWQRGAVYDQYWSEYAQWVISNGNLYYVSTDGALVALEPGSPTAGAIASLPAASLVIQDPATASQPPDRVLSPKETWDYVGQWATVEGRLVYVFNNRKAVYLTFDHPHQGHFVVRILKENWRVFPLPPEVLFTGGQTIRAQGWLGWYQGAPVMEIASPEQIEIIN